MPRKGRSKGPSSVDVHVRLSQADVQAITDSGRKPTTRAVYDAVRVYRWLRQKKGEGWFVGRKDPNGRLVTVDFLDDL